MNLLLAFHNHLRVVRDLDEHLADRLEQRQPVFPELVLLGHDQDAVKKIAKSRLEAEDNLLGLGKIALGDHRRDILLDDGKNGIEFAFLFKFFTTILGKKGLSIGRANASPTA